MEMNGDAIWRAVIERTNAACLTVPSKVRGDLRSKLLYRASKLAATHLDAKTWLEFRVAQRNTGYH